MVKQLMFRFWFRSIRNILCSIGTQQIGWVALVLFMVLGSRAPNTINICWAPKWVGLPLLQTGSLKQWEPSSFLEPSRYWWCWEPGSPEPWNVLKPYICSWYKCSSDIRFILSLRLSIMSYTCSSYICSSYHCASYKCDPITGSSYDHGFLWNGVAPNL